MEIDDTAKLNSFLQQHKLQKNNNNKKEINQKDKFRKSQRLHYGLFMVVRITLKVC